MNDQSPTSFLCLCLIVSLVVGVIVTHFTLTASVPVPPPANIYRIYRIRSPDARGSHARELREERASRK